MTLAGLLDGIPKTKRNDAIWLLQSLFNVSRSDILLSPEREFSPAEIKIWEKSWKRRLKGEPMQYIAGKGPFFGRDFLVTPQTLIPRPETERLVELSLELIKEIRDPFIVDVGTGTGAIALTIKLERPDANVLATDISSAALAVAKKNSLLLHSRVEFRKLDGLRMAHFPVAPDLIVSNPPYLDFKRDKVTKEVKNWEPRLALEPFFPQKLSGVSDRGAWIAERLLRECERIRPRHSAFELSARVASLLERRWRKNPAIERIWRESDLAGRKRFLLVAWRHA